MLIAIPIGILSALRPRSLLDRGVDDLRPDRDLGPPGLDRPDLRLLLRLQARTSRRSPGTATSINPPPASRGGPVQWAYHMILPWIDVRDPLRGALRAHDPGERDRDDERGLRAHRARQGRARVARHALAHPPERDAADRDDARHGHRPRARRRGLHRVRSTACPGSGVRRSRRSSNFDSPTVMGVIVFATTAIIFFNLLVDLLYAVIDPRIRLA